MNYQEEQIAKKEYDTVKVGKSNYTYDDFLKEYYPADYKAQKQAKNQTPKLQFTVSPTPTLASTQPKRPAVKIETPKKEPTQTMSAEERIAEGLAGQPIHIELKKDPLQLKSEEERKSQTEINRYYETKQAEYEKSKAATRANMGPMFVGDRLSDRKIMDIHDAQQYLNPEFTYEIEKKYGTYENLYYGKSNDPQFEKDRGYYQGELNNVVKNTNGFWNGTNSFINGLSHNTPDTIDYRNAKSYSQKHGVPLATQYTADQLRQMSHPVISSIGTTLGNGTRYAGEIALVASSGGVAPLIGGTIMVGDNVLDNTNDYLRDEKTAGKAIADTAAGIGTDMITGSVSKIAGTAAKGARPVLEGTGITSQQYIEGAIDMIGDYVGDVIKTIAEQPLPEAQRNLQKVFPVISEEEALVLAGALRDQTKKLNENPNFQTLDSHRQEQLLRSVREDVLEQFWQWYYPSMEY